MLEVAVDACLEVAVDARRLDWLDATRYQVYVTRYATRCDPRPPPLYAGFIKAWMRGVSNLFFLIDEC